MRPRTLQLTALKRTRLSPTLDGPSSDRGQGPLGRDNVSDSLLAFSKRSHIVLWGRIARISTYELTS